MRYPPAESLGYIHKLRDRLRKRIREKPKLAKRLMKLKVLDERKRERRKGRESKGSGNTFVVKAMEFANMEYPRPKITGVKHGKMSGSLVVVDLNKGHVELKNRRRRFVGLHDVAFRVDAKGNVVPSDRRFVQEEEMNSTKKKRKKWFSR